MTKGKNQNQTAPQVCCQLDNCCSSSPTFFKTYSGLYSQTGYLPMCKDCMNKLLHSYIEKYKDKRKAMQRICIAFDLYYSESIFGSCEDKEESMLGNYIRMLNMKQNKKKTFDTSLDEGFVFGFDEKPIDEEQDEDVVSQDDIEKWGFGLDPMDYKVLNQHYQFLKNANPNYDSNQEIFINDLCYTKMQQMKAVRNGEVENYNKLTDSYRKTFKEAGLKTTRDAAINEDFTIGVNAETIEKYTPAEYYKNKSLYRDYDNIGDYIKRFMTRPLRNLMHGTEERDYEFFVKDEGDADGYTDEE